MEVSEERKKKIEAIKSETTCPKDFACCKSEESESPNVWNIGGLLDCREPNAASCPHSYSFGHGYLCGCEVNRALHGMGKRRGIY